MQTCEKTSPEHWWLCQYITGQHTHPQAVLLIVSFQEHHAAVLRLGGDMIDKLLEFLARCLVRLQRQRQPVAFGAQK